MSVAAETNVPRSFSRRLSVGAEIVPEGGVHFRVWAPDRKNVDVILESENHASGHEVCCRLQSENDGYFAGHIAEAHAGVLYRFRLDGGPQPYPDPASRFQPQGPHGPSEVIDPIDFKWTDQTIGMALALKARCSTKCTSARSRKKELGTPLGEN